MLQPQEGLEVEVEEEDFTLQVEDDGAEREGGVVHNGSHRPEDDEEEKENNDEKDPNDDDDCTSSSSGSSMGSGIVEDWLDHIMEQDDKYRMKLCQQHWRWSLAIKDAIERETELDNLTDYWYAQLGIICEGNVTNALERAHALQAFRQEYGILETYHDGCRAIRDLVQLLPLTLLCFDFIKEEGTYIVVHDATRFDTTTLTTVDQIDTWFKGQYYMAHAACPDLQSIRRGLISMTECEGMDYTKKQDFRLLSKVFKELWSVYPFTGIVKHYNTGVFFNTMAAIFRKLLPFHLRDKFQTGCKVDDGRRLDSFFLVPNAQACSFRVVKEMEKALQRRFDNERAFSFKNVRQLNPAREIDFDLLEPIDH